jgi:hypothetical protein
MSTQNVVNVVMTFNREARQKKIQPQLLDRRLPLLAQPLLALPAPPMPSAPPELTMVKIVG